MATSKATTNVPVASILHFSFTLVSVIFLSYKVFHLERELKTVRDKLLSQAPINPGKQTTVISSSGKDVRSNRTPRLGRNLQTLGSSTSGTLKNVCLEKWIQALQVKDTGNETSGLPCIRGPPGPSGERGPRGNPGPPAPIQVNMTYITEAVSRLLPQKWRDTMKFSAPRFTSKLPLVISVMEGDKVSINVGVIGYPVPSLTCSIPRNSHGNYSQHRYEIIDGKLEIPKVSYEDTGVHICLAENVFGIARKTVKLVVFVSPRFRSSPPGQVIGYLGKPTGLPCDVTGYPTPQTKWTRFALAPLPQDRSIVKHNGLYIANTKTEDGGIYKCKAYNEYGSVINDILLKVEPSVPPFFSATPAASISVSNLRDSIRVNCSAKGSPLPTVTWYKDDVAIPVINHITADEFTSELAIDGFLIADQASYKCVAHNEYNDTVESSSKIFLVKCADPGKPKNAIIMNTGPWSGEWIRYLCHPGYTMRGAAVRRCLPSGKWSGREPLCTEKPECFDYHTIDDYTRSRSHRTQNVKCDTELHGAWYRFINSRMNTRCESDNHCDTSQAGWLHDGHPTVGEGRVKRLVCFGQSATGCCTYKTNILVRNCGNFYVYKLTSVPHCNLRYCTN